MLVIEPTDFSGSNKLFVVTVQFIPIASLSLPNRKEVTIIADIRTSFVPAERKPPVMIRFKTGRETAGVLIARYLREHKNINSPAGIKKIHITNINGASIDALFLVAAKNKTEALEKAYRFLQLSSHILEQLSEIQRLNKEEED